MPDIGRKLSGASPGLRGTEGEGEGEERAGARAQESAPPRAKDNGELPIDPQALQRIVELQDLIAQAHTDTVEAERKRAAARIAVGITIDATDEELAKARQERRAQIEARGIGITRAAPLPGWATTQ